jgi:hypothetical protein
MKELMQEKEFNDLEMQLVEAQRKLEDFEKWWESEPFGFDHPDTKMGILELLKVRDERIKELDSRLDKATTMIVNHEAKLSFTLEVLEKIRDDRSPPWDKTDFQMIAREALKQIE